MKTHRFYYGWVNLAVLFLNYFFILGTIAYAYGIVVGPMSVSTGMSLTVLSGGYTGFVLLSAVSSPAVGSLIRRFGTKRCILFGIVLTALGSAALGLVTNGPVVYYIAYALLIGVGTRLCTINPSQANLTQWFFARRGLTFSVFMCSGGIGGFLFTPLFSSMTENHSWQSVWLLIAGLCVVSFFMVLIFLKEKPEDVGQEIDNGRQYQVTARLSKVYKSRDPWSFAQVLRRKEFYCMIWVFFAASIVSGAVSVFAILYLTGAGHSTAVAAQALSYFALFSTIGRFLMGFVTDAVEAKYLIMGGAVLILFGVIGLQLAAAPAFLYLCVICAGLGCGALLIVPNTMLANYFGAHDFVRSSSFFGMISGLATAPIATIFAMIIEATGSYSGAWQTVVGAAAVCLLIGIFIRPPVFRPVRSAD